MDGVDEATCGRGRGRPGRPAPGQFGQAELDKIMRVVDSLVDAAGPGTPRWVDVTAALGDRTIAGTVGGVLGHELRTVTYSTLAPKHRLGAWVRLLAMSAARPEQPWVARSIGKGGRAPRSAPSARSGPTRPSGAVSPPATSTRSWRCTTGVCAPRCRWPATPRRRGRPPPRPARIPTAAARAAWEPGHFDGKNEQPDHRLAFGGVIALEVLLARPAGPGETGPGWAEDEPSQFGRLARYLWDDLLLLEALS